MPAKFQIRGSFHLSGRGFVLYGDVVEGVIRSRMNLHVPFNSQLAMEVPIGSVEFVDGTRTGSHVALVIPLEDTIDLPLWQGLDLVDEILEVSDPGAPAA